MAQRTPARDLCLAPLVLLGLRGPSLGARSLVFSVTEARGLCDAPVGARGTPGPTATSSARLSREPGVHSALCELSPCFPAAAQAPRVTGLRAHGAQRSSLTESGLTPAVSPFSSPSALKPLITVTRFGVGFSLYTFC